MDNQPILVESEKASENVLEFYYLTVRLKDLIRSGWKQWNVKRERLESDAEHIFSVMMLAIAMKSEFGYDVDIDKVLKMLAIHETEELVIGDITPFNKVSTEEKLESGHRAVNKIFSSLIDGEEYYKLIEEFDARITPEARFAYQCDKLDPDLMSFKYDEERASTFENASELLRSNEKLIGYAKDGATLMSEFFCLFDLEKYDDNFRAVLLKKYLSMRQSE